MTRHNKRFTWLEYPVTEFDDHTTRDRVTFGFLTIIPCRRRYDVATDDNVRHQRSIIHFGDHKTQYRSLRAIHKTLTRLSISVEEMAALISTISDTLPRQDHWPTFAIDDS